MPLTFMPLICVFLTHLVYLVEYNLHRIALLHFERILNLQSGMFYHFQYRPYQTEKENKPIFSYELITVFPHIISSLE